MEVRSGYMDAVISSILVVYHEAGHGGAREYYWSLLCDRHVVSILIVVENKE
jgi:hypothetical protein